MIRSSLKTLATAALLCAAFSGAQASVVTSGAVIAQTAYPGWDAAHLLDQSGLSLGYVSGVTDFASYVAANPTHIGTSTDSGAGWFSPLGGAHVDVDLGSTRNVTDLVLWNDNDYQGVDGFEVFVSDVADFSTSTSLGTFSATYGPDGYGNPTAAQAFNLTDGQGRYVRVNFNTAHQGDFVNVGEIAFGTDDAGNRLPEPGSLALVAAALASAVALRRKRQG